MSEENIIIPNFVGWSKVDVLNYAKLSGIDIEIEGNGFAKQQSIPAHRFIKKRGQDKNKNLVRRTKMSNSDSVFAISLLLVAFFLTVLMLPRLIKYLHVLKFGQAIREEGPQSHMHKKRHSNDGWDIFYSFNSYFTYCCNVLG